MLDGRDAAALAPFAMPPAALADPEWRDRMLTRRPVSTQALAEAVIARGFARILVSSYARGAPADALNLVLWTWDGRLALVDDGNRLGLRLS